MDTVYEELRKIRTLVEGLASQQPTKVEMLTVAEAASALNVSRRWVYDRLNRGEIATIPTSGVTRIPASEVRRLTGVSNK